MNGNRVVLFSIKGIKKKKKKSERLCFFSLQDHTEWVFFQTIAWYLTIGNASSVIYYGSTNYTTSVRRADQSQLMRAIATPIVPGPAVTSEWADISPPPGLGQSLGLACEDSNLNALSLPQEVINTI